MGLDQMPKWVRTLASSDPLSLVVVGLIGLVAGAGVYTFVYAKGYAYLSNDPAACMNCHVMREQFDEWVKSSHHTVATCNDCHMPHDNLVAKYLSKAENGFWHSLKFTTQNFREPIQIRRKNLVVTEKSCMHCHQQIFDSPSFVHTGTPGKDLSCVRCHGSVGHMNK